MEALELAPVRRAAGRLRLPGSKSISNRALLLAALARGTTRLDDLLEADDTQVMRDALEALGIAIHSLGPESVEVRGIGGATGFPAKEAEIFLGNSGTSARSLTAALAFADGRYRLSGVPRMHERPIGDLVEALRACGARIDWLGHEAFPPLSIGPWERQALSRLRIRGSVSSQFVSALLMAIPWTRQSARVEVVGGLTSRPYVDLTLAAMREFGVEMRDAGAETFEIPAGEGYLSPGRLSIEGDASTASYFLALGLLGGGPVRVEGVGSASAQGDIGFARVLEAMGGTVRWGDRWIEASGALPLGAFDLDMTSIPDAAMTAAVLALFARGPSRLRGIASWRVKETDRIAAMATELRKFGAKVEEGPDSLGITPAPEGMRVAASAGEPVSVDTYDDHRMAMSFSLAAFGSRPVRINDPGCVSKTFPGYFAAFRRLVS